MEIWRKFKEEESEMKLKNILIVVKDIEKSKQFYHDLFGLNVILDNDGNNTADVVFVNALRADSVLMAKLPAGDVYNTASALPGEELDNAPLPYIIVSFDGLTNDVETKDDPYEGASDSVTISIEIAAKTRPELGQLADAVRRQVHQYFVDADPTDEDADLIPHDYQFSAQAVNYDSLKPCYWQVLTYQCDTNSSRI